MDWIHCNTCGIQPSTSVTDIFRLTSCGHIFCQYCEKDGTIDECRICKNKNVNTIKLSQEMKQEIQVYFQDPEVLASQLMKVIEFQKGHRMRFVQFLQKKMQKYNMAKMHIAKLEEHLKNIDTMKVKLIEQNNNLKRELESYRNRQQNIVTSSPMMSNLNRPLLSTNSRASQLIKSGVDLNSSQVINSPFSLMSTPRNNYTNYRNPNITPATPVSLLSNVGGTPFSNCSKSVRSDISSNSRVQSRQPTFSMVARTPPNMNLLKIANIPPRSIAVVKPL